MRIDMRFKQASPNSGGSGAEDGLFSRPVYAGRIEMAGFCGALTTGLVLFFALAGAAASAETLSPWFHLSSISRPGNLQPGGGVNEVQELTVTATKGYVLLADPSAVTERFVVVKYDASEGELQAGLEKVYPERRVAVQALKQ